MTLVWDGGFCSVKLLRNSVKPIGKCIVTFSSILILVVLLHTHLKREHSVIESAIVKQHDDYGGREIAKTGDIVAMTVTNINDIPLTFNWLCNTKPLHVHHNLVIVATDREAFGKLKRHWPQVKSVLFDHEERLQEKHNYVDNAGYSKLLTMISEFINESLQKGVEVLCFETDTLWLQNPLGELHQTGDMCDIITSVDTSIAGDFVYFRSTNATRNLWRERVVSIKTKRLEQSPARHQMTLPSLVREAINNENYTLKIDICPKEKLQSGLWYKRDRMRARFRSDPFAVNDKFVTKTEQKERRVKNIGHWFLNSDEFTCNDTLVKNFIPYGSLASGN